MGIRNFKKEILDRLDSKTIDSQFKTEIISGLNCSPFEADAVLEVVKEVYFPFIEPTSSSILPGKITLVAVDADEPAGKPIAKCQKRTICLTVHQGPEHDRLLQEEGPTEFRRSRIIALCQEALSQGALLTREDLAYRIFFAGLRTISRDLSYLRKSDSLRAIPLRSTVQDIGPVLTHRVEIVRLALLGKTTTEICLQTHHSLAAVNNYLSTFIRCYQLYKREIDISQIAFLVNRSELLTGRYLDLIKECQLNKNMRYHLDEMLRLGCARGKKKGVAEEGL